jgi:LacI family transcriptional regulator
MPHLGIPFIGVDNRKVAEVAYDHLCRHGFRHFGFCGVKRGGHPLMDDRRDYFAALVQRSGGVCHDFPELSHKRVEPWDSHQGRIADWLKTLPRPIGVMTCNDDVGLQVLDACRRAGLLVPEEVAVIGVDNDDSLCGLAIPPLSSVDVIPERIGYEAAALLDRMMHGERPAEQHRLLPPRGVVARQSTDVMATEDRDVVRALAFIRERACHRIRVTDVLSHVGLSRTALEPRVRQVLGRTIHQEIQRVQLEQAKELLAMTDMPIKQIAARCGFATTQYLSRVFRASQGLPPAQYRRQMSR